MNTQLPDFDDKEFNDVREELQDLLAETAAALLEHMGAGGFDLPCHGFTITVRRVPTPPTH
jgi:hypothetical protein